VQSSDMEEQSYASSVIESSHRNALPTKTRPPASQSRSTGGVCTGSDRKAFAGTRIRKGGGLNPCVADGTGHPPSHE